MNRRNIIISGWPISGGTSIAIILACILKYKYVYAGGLFKYFAREIYGSDSGSGIVQFEQNFGTHWDLIWETYVEYLLNHKEGLLCEGKTTGFLHHENEAYKIMITADNLARANRARTDARAAAETDAVAERDKELKERWIRDLGVNIFDLEEIKRKYDLHLDNSEISILESLQIVVEALKENGFVISKTSSELAEYVELLMVKGKGYFIDKLEQERLSLNTAVVFAEWRALFADLVDELPSQMKNVVLK